MDIESQATLEAIADRVLAGLKPLLEETLDRVLGIEGRLEDFLRTHKITVTLDTRDPNKDT